MLRKSQVFSVITLLLPLSSAPSAAAVAQGAWARVPPLPTACYTKAETFHDDNVKAQAELEAAINTQRDLNDGLTLKLKELDLTTQQSRMMAFMTKDPAAAAKYAEDAATFGTRQRDAQARVAQKRQAVEEKLKGVQARYVSDAAPLTPLYKAFQDAAEPRSGVGRTRLQELGAAYDTAYEKLCARWWAVTSPYVTYLGELKRMLTEVAIPYGDDFIRWQKTQLDIMGIPSSGFKSTAEMQAVKEYLEAARKIYQHRPTAPLRPT